MNKPATPKYSQEQAALAHSANIKELMADRVIELLFEDVFEDQGETLRGIAEDNNLLLKSSHRSFLYKGKYFNLEDAVATYPDELQPELFARMEDFLAERKQIMEYEVPVIRGILKSMFIASDRISDYKQILPEQAHRAFDSFVDRDPKRVLLPAQLAALQKRIAPFLSVMKGRMLHNRLTNRGQTP